MPPTKFKRRDLTTRSNGRADSILFMVALSFPLITSSARRAMPDVRILSLMNR
jgi:hypothetical protein